MKILGIRVSPSTVRYAILDIKGNNIIFVNQKGENKMDFPAIADSRGKKLDWLYQELERIHSLNEGIDCIGIKEGEYTKIDNSEKRERISLEGLIQLWGYKMKIAVITKIYGGIKGVKSSDAKSFCESNFGRTEKYWSKEMAEALLAAWALREV